MGCGRREIKDARTMWKETREREFGNLRPNLFSSRIFKSRISSIQLSNSKELVSSHRGSVNSLQVLFPSTFCSIFNFLHFLLHLYYFGVSDFFFLFEKGRTFFYLFVCARRGYNWRSAISYVGSMYAGFCALCVCVMNIVSSLALRVMMIVIYSLCPE